MVLCGRALRLASCATFQRWGDEGAVKQVADDINAGKAQALAAMSVTPFLVDGEIVLDRRRCLRLLGWHREGGLPGGWRGAGPGCRGGP